MSARPGDLDAIRSAVVSIAHHIDRKRWDELRALFADEVRTDYTSLFGGVPQAQGADALVGGWRGLLARVATQHLLGPVAATVEGDRATATCHVRALHLAEQAPGGATWEVLGHYRFALARRGPGWAVAGITLETFAQLGNARLLAEAAGG